MFYKSDIDIDVIDIYFLAFGTCNEAWSFLAFLAAGELISGLSSV